mmetsp:Transcript_20320/g.61229  ORF Transcript_20320/g.61229 Transcript_20320/m.61229 type:complete len:157 (-) Transcript_20320:1919-2389(-)|eukprot:CAMPEP_0206140724 /NCGR_PEP_ID=MMETSP1473-20131121/10446_1 /ASSEMBLY_ACC=CAM_ASM_001109 /TAXON_ID=1461547 /ORGANISM="Stichococcus sp, Strain RCC1054" /LENGTH=156 /DNA_ID=CAMNT_0053534977 /DNA_START=142 /DNA_END=612 /DNA_ORIENTATION=+
MAAEVVQQTELFTDIFEITDKDPDGKKFDKVSRIKAKSEVYEMDLLLDVNVDIYPLDTGEKFSLALATTLNLDNAPMGGHYDQSLHPSNTKGMLSDHYEYVMHGKIFKYKATQQGGQPKVEVTISFGGLLLQLIGDPAKLEVLELDTFIFLLMRKV